MEMSPCILSTVALLITGCNFNKVRAEAMKQLSSEAKLEGVVKEICRQPLKEFSTREQSEGLLGVLVLLVFEVISYKVLCSSEIGMALFSVNKGIISEWLVLNS